MRLSNIAALLLISCTCGVFTPTLRFNLTFCFVCVLFVLKSLRRPRNRLGSYRLRFCPPLYFRCSAHVRKGGWAHLGSSLSESHKRQVMVRDRWRPITICFATGPGMPKRFALRMQNHIFCTGQKYRSGAMQYFAK